WSDYAGDGHGGNKELKRLVESVGLDYVRKNFQYTILENYNARVDDDYVRVRESYWKKVLCSRNFGYNDN
ncbi:MAG: GIY-YIG nuclease family protein, partial [Lancefieldella rimae]